MIIQFLVTVEVAAAPPGDRLQTIREEVAAHAGACVEFYGRVKPSQVACIEPLADRCLAESCVYPGHCNCESCLADRASHDR